MQRYFALAFAALFSSAVSLHAETFVPVTLEPISHNTASLVIVAGDGTETTYSPAELEALPTYSVTTRTPWREEPAEFSGVLLSDLLEAHGLTDIQEIVVTAENDYSTSLNRDLMDDVQILVATRVNGRPHTRRERGPIQFVIEQNEFETSSLTSESNFVWMAARIEPGS